MRSFPVSYLTGRRPLLAALVAAGSASLAATALAAGPDPGAATAAGPGWGAPLPGPGLKDALKLTPAQDSAWTQYLEAMRQFYATLTPEQRQVFDRSTWHGAMMDGPCGREGWGHGRRSPG